MSKIPVLPVPAPQQQGLGGTLISHGGIFLASEGVRGIQGKRSKLFRPGGGSESPPGSLRTWPRACPRPRLRSGVRT